MLNWAEVTTACRAVLGEAGIELPPSTPRARALPEQFGAHEGWYLGEQIVRHTLAAPVHRSTAWSNGSQHRKSGARH